MNRLAKQTSDPASSADSTATATSSSSSGEINSNSNSSNGLVIHLIRDALVDARTKLSLPQLNSHHHQPHQSHLTDIYRQYPDFNAEYSTQQRLMLIFLNLASDASLSRTAQTKSRQLYEKSKSKFARLHNELQRHKLAECQAANESSAAAVAAVAAAKAAHAMNHNESRCLYYTFYFLLS